MSLKAAAKSILEYLQLPGRVQDERTLELTKNLMGFYQRVQNEGDQNRIRSESELLKQTAALQPGLSDVRTAEADADAERAMRIQSGQTKNVGDLMERGGGVTRSNIDAHYSGAGQLAQTQGNVDLERQTAQNRAISELVSMQHAQELGQMDRVIGQQPLIPQVLGTTRSMQTERLGVVRDLAEMAQPSPVARALGYIRGLGQTAAELGIVFGRRG